MRRPALAAADPVAAGKEYQPPCPAQRERQREERRHRSQAHIGSRLLCGMRPLIDGHERAARWAIHVARLPRLDMWRPGPSTPCEPAAPLGRKGRSVEAPVLVYRPAQEIHDG